MRFYRWLAALAIVVVAGFAGAAAVGTPPFGFVTSASRGTFGDEASIRASNTDMATGIRWYGRHWMPRELPSFQRALLAHGVRDIVEWTKLHPGAATRLGVLPLSAHPSKQIAVVRGTMQPGGLTGFHHHPVPEIALVMSGELTIYRVDGRTCKLMYRVGPGQAGVVPANHVMFARNEGAVPVEQFTIFLGIPAGTATSFDEPDPGACPFSEPMSR
jgi:quercetin dioxygenase-like cupin family protein